MINKKEFIAEMAAVNETTKVHAEEAYHEVFDVLIPILTSGEEVALPGLGRWVIKEKDACVRRNPRTGEEVDVPAHKVMKFKIASTIGDAVKDIPVEL